MNGCDCSCHCGGYDGAGTCKQPCDSCDSSAGCPSRKTNDQKFALSRDNLVSNGWLALNHFVEETLGIGPVCVALFGVKEYFLEPQDHLRIKAWLVAMGEYDLSRLDCFWISML